MGRYQNICNLGKDSVILTSDMWTFVSLHKSQANFFHSYSLVLCYWCYFIYLVFLSLKSSKVILHDECGIVSSALTHFKESDKITRTLKSLFITQCVNITNKSQTATANRLLASSCLPLGACWSSLLGATTHNLAYIWRPSLRKKKMATLILLASSLKNVSNSSRNTSGYSPRHRTQCTGMSLRGRSVPCTGTWHTQSTFKWF